MNATNHTCALRTACSAELLKEARAEAADDDMLEELLEAAAIF